MLIFQAVKIIECSLLNILSTFNVSELVYVQDTKYRVKLVGLDACALCARVLISQN